MEFIRCLLILAILASCNGEAKRGAGSGNTARIGVEHPVALSIKINDTFVRQLGREYRLSFGETGEDSYLLSVYRDGELCLSRDFGVISGVGIAEFLDFDRDSLYDVLVDWSDMEASNDLYLFFPDSSSFREVGGFFGKGVRPVTGAKDVYYAYSSYGCPDMDWGSDLFTIRDFRVVDLASMYVQECKEPYEVSISKLVGKESVFVGNIPFDENEDSLMEAYWNKNWRKFTDGQASR